MFGFVSILVCARYARACAYARCLLHVLVRDGAGGVSWDTSARALRWIHDSDLTAAPRPIPPARPPPPPDRLRPPRRHPAVREWPPRTPACARGPSTA